MRIEHDLDFNTEEFRRNAYAYYRQLRAEAPVFLSQPAGQFPVWYVTGAVEVEQVLLDSQRFARDPSAISSEYAAMFRMGDKSISAMVDNHMLNRDGESHRRLRKLVSKAFTLKAITAMRPRIQQIANELLDPVVPNGKMELVQDYAFPLPIIVIAELLGVPDERREDFRRWSDVMVRADGENIPELEKCYRDFSNYMLELIGQRRLQPQDDLISSLVHIEDEGARLAEGELCSMIVLLIVAGHETTVSLIGNSISALLQHPTALRDLQASPELLPGAVEELLRYDPPVERAMVRFITDATELGGQALQRGQIVFAILASANRDERTCPNAETLDIRRPACPHMAFGKGIHYCLGASLARLETEIAIGTLLRRLPALEMDIAPEQLRWRNTANFRSLTQLPVRWAVS
ncbi:cytochrome P450 family protein [Pseudomonas borbori]